MSVPSGSSRSARPPGPSMVEAVRLAHAFRHGSIDAFESLRQRYGELVYLPRPIDAYVLLAPRHVARVLQENHRNYTKSTNYRQLAYMMGQGLVTSEGEAWVAQRRRVAGAFRGDVLRRYAEYVTVTAERWASDLCRRRVGGPAFDLAEELGVLTAALSCAFLFGRAELGAARELRDLVSTASEVALRRIYAPVRLPRWVPTRHHRRERAARHALDAFAFDEISRARRTSGLERRRTVLSALIEPDANGTVLAGTELRDQVVTFLMAGQDTIEAALSWLFCVLGSRVELQREIVREIHAVPSEQRDGFEQLESLAWTRAGLLETLRLYPPIPLFARTPVQDDVLDGFRIPAGAVVLCAVRAIQRDAAHWPDPGALDPQRFLGASAASHGASFAFGAGPRKCIGERLAMLEMTAVVAALVPKAIVSLEHATIPEAHTTIAMKPSGGVRVMLSPRPAEPTTNACSGEGLGK